MHRRGSNAFKILDSLAHGAQESLIVFAAYCSTPHPTFGRIRGAERRLRRMVSAAEQERAVKKRFAVFMSRLQRDGLVVRDGVSWRILKKGKESLRYLRARILPEAAYHQEPDLSGPPAIITFDIPEKERRKRTWLRSALAGLDCSIIHKSVWLSKRPLPRRFIEDIHRLDIARYVHIFAVAKKGTISDILA